MLFFMYHRSTRQIAEHAQVVPDSVVRSKSEDCMVPDQEDEVSPTTHSLPQLSTPNIDMNAVRLTLSPMLIADLDSHSNHPIHMPVLGSSPVHMTPSSPTAVTGPLLPYFLTDFPPTHAERPRPSFSGHNPFVSPVPSSTLLPNISPSNSLNTRQHSNSLVNLPESPPANTHASPHGSPLSSYPPPAFVCHRYPVTLSLSGDSFFSTHTESRIHGNDRLPTSEQAQHSSMDDSNTGPRTVESRISPSQSVMDSLVTIRPNRHSFSAGVSVDSIRSPLNRHSLSSERLSPQHFIPASTHSQTQRRRRNSSGTERVRRHSHQAVSGSAVTSLEGTRRRRRSHDIRDERTELLEGLRAASSRRTSRTHSNPFSVPIRIQLSSPGSSATEGNR